MCGCVSRDGINSKGGTPHYVDDVTGWRTAAQPHNPYRTQVKGHISLVEQVGRQHKMLRRHQMTREGITFPGAAGSSGSRTPASAP